MKYFLIVILFIVFNDKVCSQAVVKQFLNKECVVTSSEGAYYYRTIEEKDTLFVVRDFLLSDDVMVMEAICSSYTPKLIYEGKVNFYYENGNLKRECTYRDNILLGLTRDYYEDGSLQMEMICRKEKSLYCQYFTEEGKPVLLNGTGFIIDTRNKTRRLRATHLEVKDSLLLFSYCILPESGDTIYGVVEVPTEYKGGLKSFYNSLAKELRGKYPKQARRMGVEGRVFIEFVIDENGKPQESSILKGIGAGCDEVALEAFRKQKKWVPGVNQGKKVKTCMILPIVFKLG